MTVVVLAKKDDITVDRVLLMLTERGVPVVRLDTADIPDRASLHASFTAGRWSGRLRSGPHTVELARIRSVWNRTTRACAWPDGMTAAERRHADLEVRLGLGGVLADLPVHWVNHPAAQADADYKPRQLVMAARCGLEVPDTLVTSDRDEVAAFAAAGPAVIKPLGVNMLIEGADASIAYTHLLTAELWRIVEDAHDWWTTASRPGWDRFGLSVTQDAQTVWLDDPDHEIAREGLRSVRPG